MDASRARNIAELHASRAKEEEQRSVQKVTLDNIFEKIKEGEMKQLDIIVKADVQGSVEALVQSFMGIKSDEVRIAVVHSGVGGITESDVMLASASNALIIGFNVRLMRMRGRWQKKTVWISGCIVLSMMQLMM